MVLPLWISSPFHCTITCVILQNPGFGHIPIPCVAMAFFSISTHIPRELQKATPTLSTRSSCLPVFCLFVYMFVCRHICVCVNMRDYLWSWLWQSGPAMLWVYECEYLYVCAHLPVCSILILFLSFLSHSQIINQFIQRGFWLNHQRKEHQQ